MLGAGQCSASRSVIHVATSPESGPSSKARPSTPLCRGGENLVVLVRLGGLENKAVDSVLGRVGLTSRALDPFRTYSLGMRQRLGIAAALLPGPELLVLDEPTNGLDPHGIAEIRAMLRSFADDGMTVFVSSHLLTEIQQICEHLVVIENGRLIFQGGVDELLAAKAPELIVRTENPGDARYLLALVKGTGRSARMLVHTESSTVEIVADASFAAELNRLAMANGITLVHLSERRSTLEEAFFDITRTGPSQNGATAAVAAETKGQVQIEHGGARKVPGQ